MVSASNESVDSASHEEASPNSKTAEGWKQIGNEAYKDKDWYKAIKCYTSALQLCERTADIAVACLNNRAACHAQLKNHEQVIRDATEVIVLQPANTKALLRRMVAYDTLQKKDLALQDAASVLTMEPKNPHALQVVDKKRQSLTKKATDNCRRTPSGMPTETMCVFLMTEDRPLQCYSCLRSLRKHMKGVILNVHVFWQAADPKCFHSYQLLQTLPDTSRVQSGQVSWMEVSKGRFFDTFSRTINRISVEGLGHVLLLSDTVLFHTDVDASSALKLLSARKEAFSVRFDVNPRVDFFPEASRIISTPHMENFSGDENILLWTRWYDKSKQAFEAVPREMGWHAILDWTATMVRTTDIQHFFSALLPPIENATVLDEKAADWLSRRQRMKRSEVKHRSACYRRPVLVTIDPEELGDGAAAEALLRAHLLDRYGTPKNGGDKVECHGEFAKQLGWKVAEVSKYFEGIDTNPKFPLSMLGLLEPDRYRDCYFDSVRAPSKLATFGVPSPLSPPAPLVSWLVPVRNAESFILDCLGSMETQTAFNSGSYEIVLVEDGSDDGSLAVLRKYASKHSHVRVVENGVQMGVAGSLSEGWRKCRGDFVARLDSDDISEPDRLVKQLRYLDQHKTISVVGGRTRAFWTEERKFTIEKVTEKEDGRVVAVVWREFHGNQTSRMRHQITLQEKDASIELVDGPSEYHGCRVIRVAEESLILNPHRWRDAMRAAQRGNGEVIMQRTDPLEPPKGSTALHPTMVRASLLFEDCIAGTTATFRRADFPEEGPFQREESDTHWCWLGLEHRHAANIADSVVRVRRHEGQKCQRDHACMYESQCAAVQYHLTKVHGVDFNMRDAATTLRFRGPTSADQGEKVLVVLKAVENNLIAEFLRPQDEQARGEFWKDFIRGREVALERGLVQLRMRFKELSDKIAEVITSVPEHEPREHRSRTPPR